MADRYTVSTLCTECGRGYNRKHRDGVKEKLSAARTTMPQIDKAALWAAVEAELKRRGFR